MTLLAQFLNWTLNKDEKERKYKTFYLKSAVFLVLSVILIGDKFMKFNMMEGIELLLGDTVVSYILGIAQVGIQFFSTLTLISVGVYVISIIIYKAMCKIFEDDERIDYFHRLIIGAMFRVRYSLENILICMLVGYLFDERFIRTYKIVYSQKIYWIIIFACGLEFCFSSLHGVINRFFLLNINIDTDRYEVK